MAAIARGNETDTVASPDGTGPICALPTTQATEQCSGNVLINGIGIVREGDYMKHHPGPGCGDHAPTLSSFSSTVKANGKGVGRVGDDYAGHVITSGSGNANAG
jgi:uncharacterized Zn-binding protein involved in type VI secretion